MEAVELYMGIIKSYALFQRSLSFLCLVGCGQV